MADLYTIKCCNATYLSKCSYKYEQKLSILKMFSYIWRKIIMLKMSYTIRSDKGKTNFLCNWFNALFPTVWLKHVVNVCLLLLKPYIWLEHFSRMRLCRQTSSKIIYHRIWVQNCGPYFFLDLILPFTHKCSYQNTDKIECDHQNYCLQVIVNMINIFWFL